MTPALPLNEVDRWDSQGVENLGGFEGARASPGLEHTSAPHRCQNTLSKFNKKKLRKTPIVIPMCNKIWCLGLNFGNPMKIPRYAFN